MALFFCRSWRLGECHEPLRCSSFPSRLSPFAPRFSRLRQTKVCTPLPIPHSRDKLSHFLLFTFYFSLLFPHLQHQQNAADGENDVPDPRAQPGFQGAVVTEHLPAAEDQKIDKADQKCDGKSQRRPAPPFPEANGAPNSTIIKQENG